MKPEPLKNKRDYNAGEDGYIYMEDDVKSAVEWLRIKLCDGRCENDNGEKVVCREAMLKKRIDDFACDSCKYIDKAFEDVIKK